MRPRWPWLVALALAVGAWFGWRHTLALRDQAAAHEQFVDAFQNGIRGSYNGAEAQPPAHPAAVEVGSDFRADQAIGLSSDQVLLRSPFGGGVVAGRCILGGQAILWQPEPHRYSVTAALNLGDGEWEAANNLTTIAVAPEGPFHDLAVLNPPWDRERAVLIQALFGRVTDRQAGRLVVELVDGTVLDAEVRQGLWLVAVTSPELLQLDGAQLRLYDNGGSLLREGPLKDERVR